MKIGDFVTAKLMGRDDCRQGIFTVDISRDVQPEIIVLGESGAEYVCEANATVVPDENLHGHTFEWVKRWRERNLPPIKGE